VFRHALEKWLNVILRGVKFKDLESPLSIVCTNIETGGPVIFSRDTAPEMKRGDGRALLGGHSRLFAVKRVNGAVLVDGGLTPIDESLLFRRLGRGADHPHDSRSADASHAFPLRLSAYIQRVASLLLTRGRPRFFPAPVAADPHDPDGHSLGGRFRSVTPRTSTTLYQAGYDQCQALSNAKEQNATNLAERSARSR